MSVSLLGLDMPRSGQFGRCGQSTADNPHSHSCDSADYFGLIKIGEPANRLRRGYVWHQNELSVFQFTPTAGITISELDEIDGPPQFLSPCACPDLCLCRIDLQERPREY